MRKALSLISILILAATCILMAESASAQSTPKPSVPQFSIRVVDYSYDVPTTYTTDSYTGKQVTHSGYHVNDIRVEGKIKNQHFTPYTIPNPNSTSSYDTNLNIDFYYNIRYKGHFGNESEWMLLCGTRDVDFLKQDYGSEYTNFTAAGYNARMFQDGAVIDFQVKAHIGFETWGFVGTFPYRILNGEDSGWSNTLTVTISKDTTSSSAYATTIDSSSYPTLTSPQTLPAPTPPTSTPTPSVPEFPVLAILPLFAAIPLILIMLRRKTSKS
jgi:hypothetical protein